MKTFARRVVIALAIAGLVFEGSVLLYWWHRALADEAAIGQVAPIVKAAIALDGAESGLLEQMGYRCDLDDAGESVICTRAGADPSGGSPAPRFDPSPGQPVESEQQ